VNRPNSRVRTLRMLAEVEKPFLYQSLENF